MAQIYVIDHFLWILAGFGWTLQRTRKKLDFADIEEALAGNDSLRHQMETEMLRNLLKKGKEENG